MIIRRSFAGPFPPLITAPPLFPPAPTVQQPRKTGPDSVLYASCKSDITSDQAKLIMYDTSSFVSCTALNAAVTAMCTTRNVEMNEESCDHNLQILHIPNDNKAPVWSIVKASRFARVFSQLSLNGHLAVMDDQSNLFVPLLAGAIDYLEIDHMSSKLRHASVKTVAHILATVASHPRANLSSLLLEPCSASLCDLRFRDVITIVDLARRQLPDAQKMRLEVRAVTPTKVKMSFCKFHPHAPRVCTQCFYQSPSASSCPHCLKQYIPLQSPKAKSPCPTPAFEESEPPVQSSPSPTTYANLVKNGVVPPAVTPSHPPPMQVITKITNIEREMQCQADNLKVILEQLYTLSQTQNSQADKLTKLEDSSAWKDVKHKTCQSTKKVDSNTATLKKVSLEVSVLSGNVKQLQCSYPPIDAVKLTAQVDDKHKVMMVQVADLTKQVTEIQASLYKQLTSSNAANPQTPSPSAASPHPPSADNPPPTTSSTPPTDFLDPQDVVNI